MEVLCATCNSRHCSLFRELPDEAVRALDDEKHVRHYAPGQVVFFEDGEPNAVFCVKAGRVKLFKVGGEDDEVVVGLAGPGTVIGYRGVITETAHTTTAEVIENAIVCAIPAPLIRRMTRTQPGFKANLMQRLVGDLRSAEEELVSRAADSVSSRTAKFLLEWIGHGNESSDAGTEITISRREMASIIGTTPETLSRVLKSLANKELIRVTRKDLKILDRSALSTLAGLPR